MVNVHIEHLANCVVDATSSGRHSQRVAAIGSIRVAHSAGKRSPFSLAWRESSYGAYYLGPGVLPVQPPCNG